MVHTVRDAFDRPPLEHRVSDLSIEDTHAVHPSGVMGREVAHREMLRMQCLPDILRHQGAERTFDIVPAESIVTRWYRSMGGEEGGSSDV